MYIYVYIKMAELRIPCAGHQPWQHCPALFVRLCLGLTFTPQQLGDVAMVGGLRVE